MPRAVEVYLNPSRIVPESVIVKKAPLMAGQHGIRWASQMQVQVHTQEYTQNQR